MRSRMLVAFLLVLAAAPVASQARASQPPPDRSPRAQLLALIASGRADRHDILDAHKRFFATPMEEGGLGARFENQDEVHDDSVFLTGDMDGDGDADVVTEDSEDQIGRMLRIRDGRTSEVIWSLHVVWEEGIATFDFDRDGGLDIGIFRDEIVASHYNLSELLPVTPVRLPNTFVLRQHVRFVDGDDGSEIFRRTADSVLVEDTRAATLPSSPDLPAYEYATASVIAAENILLAVSGYPDVTGDGKTDIVVATADVVAAGAADFGYIDPSTPGDIHSVYAGAARSRIALTAIELANGTEHPPVEVSGQIAYACEAYNYGGCVLTGQDAWFAGGGDIDGDGMHDLVIYREDDLGASLEARHFLSGRQIWFREIEYAGSTGETVDFDGDGLFDILLSGFDIAEGVPTVRGVSLRTGIQRWELPDTLYGPVTQILEFGQDVDGDGGKDPMLLRTSDALSVEVEVHRGSDGSLLSTRRFSVDAVEGERATLRFCSGCLTDHTGDGAADLLLTTSIRDASNKLVETRQRLVELRDGTIAWTLVAGPERANTFGFPSDANGNGTRDFYAPERTRDPVRVALYEGASGLDIWAAEFGDASRSLGSTNGADLDGDGRWDLVLGEIEHTGGGGFRTHVRAFTSSGQLWEL